jgi:hypothetical protein
MKKSRVFILFLILSVTPFIRGCGESFGFPLPAFSDILKDNSVGALVCSLSRQLTNAESILPFMANLLFSVLFARILLRRSKDNTILNHVPAALTINLTFVWSVVALFLIFPQEGPGNRIGNFLLEKYGEVFFLYFYKVPQAMTKFLLWIIPHQRRVQQGIYIVDPMQDPTDEVTSRAWFVVVTFLLAAGLALFYKWRSNKQAGHAN